MTKIKQFVIQNVNGKVILIDIIIATILMVLVGLADYTARAQETNHQNKLPVYKIAIFEPKVAVKQAENPAPDHIIESTTLNRVENLRAFFNKYNSVLADEAEIFVEVADEYGLDYRLLPAIAGIESTFCKQIIVDSYNCYGWGIYGNNVIRFESYEDGIRKVGKGIYEGYVVKGADTPEKMAPIYTPPNHAKWLNSVRFFMGQIG